MWEDPIISAPGECTSLNTPDQNLLGVVFALQ